MYFIQYWVVYPITKWLANIPDKALICELYIHVAYSCIRWSFGLLYLLSGTCKDLNLGLDSTVDRAPYSHYIPLLLITILNSHNLDQVMVLNFLLTTNLSLFLSICMDLGYRLQHLMWSTMVLQQAWCQHIIPIMFMLIPRHQFTCTRLNILCLHILECLLLILMDTFNLLCRFSSSFHLCHFFHTSLFSILCNLIDNLHICFYQCMASDDVKLFSLSCLCNFFNTM